MEKKTRTLPDRRDYVGSFRWLMAVQECIGQPFVFALDDAFMCMELFLGYNTESVVYGYGDSSIAEAFPQVVLLGADIDEIEALSAYYFRHGESTDGISVKDDHAEDFERILAEAKEYYDY